MSKAPLLILILITLLFSSERSIIPKDSLALLSIIEANPQARLNWSPDLPIQQWQGVQQKDHRVIGLDLIDKRIITIPPEIEELHSLSSLALHNNEITILPKELFTLDSLQNLYLCTNNLTSIPSDIGKLTNIETLSLYSNKLTEIPPQIGELQNLRSLELHDNALTTLPKELRFCGSLKGLTISNNQMDSLPSELSFFLSTLYKYHFFKFDNSGLNKRDLPEALNAERSRQKRKGTGSDLFLTYNTNIGSPLNYSIDLTAGMDFAIGRATLPGINAAVEPGINGVIGGIGIHWNPFLQFQDNAIPTPGFFARYTGVVHWRNDTFLTEGVVEKGERYRGIEVGYYSWFSLRGGEMREINGGNQYYFIRVGFSFLLLMNRLGIDLSLQ